MSISAQIAPPIREAQRLAKSTGRSVAVYQKSSGEYYLVQEAYEVLPGSVRRYHTDPPVGDLTLDAEDLAARVAKLEAALAPFSHPDLSETLQGNVQGDSSPIFGRNKALLTLGDFRRARAALNHQRENHE